MAATLTTKGVVDVVENEIDPNASPLDTNTTPATDYSPPSSPYQNVLKDKRLAAKVKLAKLTQKEKVSSPVM